MISAMSPLRAVVGPGRSGTTWAGALIDSCPDVVYRFEPFHRMAAIQPEFLDWFEKLKNQSVREKDVPRLYSILCRAHPLTNKAPFFADKSYPLATFGRSQLWPLARVFPPARALYQAVYSPQPGPPLVFKEVTFIKPLQNLLEHTSVPIAYLVRHPCATVLSDVSGQVQGRMPPRQRRLRELLLEHGPPLAERFSTVVAGSDIVRRTALLWRCEIEACVPLVQRSNQGMVFTYEQLADDAFSQLRALFEHLGLAWTDQTERFLEMLYGVGSSDQVGPRRTGWGAKYFSVYRNPKETKDSWKQRMSSDDRRKVEAIVEDSPAFQYCAALGRWN